MMKIYYKNKNVISEEEFIETLNLLDDFIKNPEPGKPMPQADAQLMKIWNGGDHLDYEFSEETKEEAEQREAEKALLDFYKNAENLEAWKDAKVRPLRNALFDPWINDVSMRPTKYKSYNVTQEEIDAKHKELCDWPSTFEAWVSDEEIEAAKPSPPSWIS